MQDYTLTIQLKPEDLVFFQASPIVLCKTSNTTNVLAWISFIPTTPSSISEGLPHSEQLSGAEPLTYKISWQEESDVYGTILEQEKKLQASMLINALFQQNIPPGQYIFDGDVFQRDHEAPTANESKNTNDNYVIVNRSLYPHMVFGCSTEPTFTGNYRFRKLGVPPVNMQLSNQSIGALPTDANQAVIAKDSSNKTNTCQTQQSKTEPNNWPEASFTPTQTIRIFTLPHINTSEVLPTLPDDALVLRFSSNQSTFNVSFNMQTRHFVIDT